MGRPCDFLPTQRSRRIPCSFSATEDPSPVSIVASTVRTSPDSVILPDPPELGCVVQLPAQLAEEVGGPLQPPDYHVEEADAPFQ